MTRFIIIIKLCNTLVRHIVYQIIFSFFYNKKKKNTFILIGEYFYKWDNYNILNHIFHIYVDVYF